MTNQKKSKLNIVVFVLLICFVVLSFGGCTKDENKSSVLSVVAVSFAQYDFARNICGEYADVTMLSKPGGDVHGYEPSLNDIKKIADSDVFIYNGGESDGWVEKILKSVDNPSVIAVRLCDYVELLCTHEEDAHHGEHSHFDEHIQSSPKNAVLMTEAICRAVSLKDEEHKEIFESNAKKYISEINLIDKELEQISADAKNRTMIVADRFPFLYLSHQYKFEYKALFSGCSQENDANPSVMTDMIETVKENNIPVVFYTELSSGKMADTLCEETGAGKLLLHSCEGISREDFENGITYVDIMKKNIINLKEALL